MLVYLVVPQGIGAQLPVGVFRTREAAETAVKAVWPRTDGYHELDIHEYATGVVYDSFSRGVREYMGSDDESQYTTREVCSDFNAEADRKRLS